MILSVPYQFLTRRKKIPCNFNKKWPREKSWSAKVLVTFVQQEFPSWYFLTIYVFNVEEINTQTFLSCGKIAVEFSVSHVRTLGSLATQGQIERRSSISKENRLGKDMNQLKAQLITAQSQLIKNPSILVSYLVYHHLSLILQPVQLGVLTTIPCISHGTGNYQ